MRSLIVALIPGKEAKLRLRRDAREFDLPITIGKRPKPPRQEE